VLASAVDDGRSAVDSRASGVKLSADRTWRVWSRLARSVGIIARSPRSEAGEGALDDRDVHSRERFSTESARLPTRRDSTVPSERRIDLGAASRSAGQSA